VVSEFSRDIDKRALQLKIVLLPKMHLYDKIACGRFGSQQKGNIVSEPFEAILSDLIKLLYEVEI
jgi:hypothetical protein